MCKLVHEKWEKRQTKEDKDILAVTGTADDNRFSRRFATKEMSMLDSEREVIRKTFFEEDLVLSLEKNGTDIIRSGD